MNNQFMDLDMFHSPVIAVFPSNSVPLGGVLTTPLQKIIADEELTEYNPKFRVKTEPNGKKKWKLLDIGHPSHSVNLSEQSCASW